MMFNSIVFHVAGEFVAVEGSVFGMLGYSNLLKIVSICVLL